MAEVRLKAVKRIDVGKGSSRRSRTGGRVPAVLYGGDLDPVAIEVDRREFITALNTDAGMNVLLDIEIDGDTTLALTRELQRDPVAGKLLHADFVKIDRTQKIDVIVPVHTVGTSPGVSEGGVLDQTIHELAVRCLPGEVPESIDADISGLAIGDGLRVSDLTPPEGVEITQDPDESVVAIAAPISEAELEAMEAGAGVVQEPTDAEEAAAAEAGEAAPGEAPAGGEGEPPADEG